MKKVILSFMMIIVMSFTAVIPAFSQTVSSGSNIYDEMGLVPDTAEFDRINEELNQISLDNEVGVFIATKASDGAYGSYTLPEFLQVIMTEQGFTTVAPNGGIIVAVDQAENFTDVYTYGSAGELLSEAYYERMLADFLRFYGQSDFVGAFDSVVLSAKDMFAGAPASNISSEEIVPIYDWSDFMTDEQEATLTARIEVIRSTYDVDITLVTTPSLDGMGITTYADSFQYIDMVRDGIVFVQDTVGRDFYTSVRGDLQAAYNEEARDYTTEKVTEYLSDDDYYGAYNKYLDVTSEILKVHQNGGTFTEPVNLLMVIGIGLVGGVIIAFIVSSALKSQMNTAVKERAASNYVKPGSLNITRSFDRFLYQHTTKTARAKSNSSGGGGGGGGMSSGGRSSGGGGSY